MNDMSLIGHMSGQGEVVADKLRQAGYTTLQKIMEEKPSVLAESTGLELSIISKIINSTKALSRTHPAVEAKAKAKKKAEKKAGKKATAPPKKKTAKAEKKVVKAAPPGKKVKRPTEKPKEPIPEKPIFDPLQRVAHSFAAEHEIPVTTAIRFVDGVKKSPSTREKILKEVIVREEFRERLANRLARELT